MEECKWRVENREMKFFLIHNIIFLDFTKNPTMIIFLRNGERFLGSGFVLRECTMCQGGSLKFGTVLIITKGGCHHGKRNREVVQ